jgi:hypothetical protein
MKLDLELRSVVSEHSELRKYPRLKVDLGTFIKLYLDVDNCKFLKGIVTDSSLGGCGIVIAVKQEQEDLLEENKIYHIKFFEECDDYVEIRIAWFKKIDDNLWKLGFQYIDSIDDIFSD